MRRSLTYGSLFITSLVVVGLFLSAQTYTQLTAASLLYLPLAYFAFKAFSGGNSKETEVTVRLPITSTQQHSEYEHTEEGHVIDVDKRAFLNLIGAAGLSFFLYSLFSRNGSSSFFGKTFGSGSTKLEDTEGKAINPAERQPLDGYRISEIDDSESSTYYGFTNANGAWLIMKEESDSSSYRYVKGDGNFPEKWNDRVSLNYDYYFNVF